MEHRKRGENLFDATDGLENIASNKNLLPGFEWLGMTQSSE